MYTTQPQGYTVRMQRWSCPIPHPTSASILLHALQHTEKPSPVSPWHDPIPPLPALARRDQLGAAGVARPESVLSLSFPVLFSAIESASFTISGSCSGVFPSHASWMSDIVLSRLRRRVLGLVIVVPRLACRPCPRRNGDAVDDKGDPGEMGDPGEGSCPSDVLIAVGGAGVVAMTCSSAAATPLGDTVGAVASSDGVAGWEEMRPLPSSDSGSYRSGGRRSFSISDFRLARRAQD